MAEKGHVMIMEHPLIQHKISMLRDKRTGTNEFRKLVEEIAAMIEFGSRGLMSAEDIAQRCYANRYRTEAFRLCRLLNGEGK